VLQTVEFHRRFPQYKMMHLDSIFGTTGLEIHCTDVGVLQREHAGGQQDSSFLKVLLHKLQR
jgi:hypothetical protein